MRKTAEGEAPWQLYGIELDKEGLLYLADHIEENAIQQVGVGDMSIIHAYEQYKSNTPGIGRIMIWSTDTHLQGYIEENVQKLYIGDEENHKLKAISLEDIAHEQKCN